MASLKKKLKDIAHNFNTLLNKLYYIITNIKQKRWEKIEDQETLENKNLSLDIGCNIFLKKNGVPGWTRTNDPLINSQML